MGPYSNMPSVLITNWNFDRKRMRCKGQGNTNTPADQGTPKIAGIAPEA